MRRGFKRILVAARNIEGFSASTVAKIAALAARGARVEFFHAITESELLETARRDRSGRPAARVASEIAEKTSSRLAAIPRRRLRGGLRVTTLANWDYPAHEAIVRRALATRAELVVIEAPRHPTDLRPFLSNTDWQLIRHCPCALLLARGRSRYERAKVLVAVDPFHVRDKPAALDRRLLKMGGRIAHGLHGELHACHVYVGFALSVERPGARTARLPSPLEVAPRPEAAVRRAVDRLAAREGVTPARRHLRIGRASVELAHLAGRIHARILVMGAVSRAGGARAFIGSTAERALDRVPCDVLIVKPAGFRSPIAKHAVRFPERLAV